MTGTLKFRPHRGSLDESMAETRVVEASLAALAAIASEEAGVNVSPEQIEVKPYGGYDNRTGWNTFIVTVGGVGVIGFTNGPVAVKL